MKAIIGKKVGMSQILDENGHVIPVTVIEAGPCTVVQKKTSEKEGYNAVQLGYEDVAEKKLTKGEMGHLNKAGVSPKKYLREFDLDNASELELGAIIKVDPFKAGDFVDVTGTSKGHGDTGVIKRWNASRGVARHEPHHDLRRSERGRFARQSDLPEQHGRRLRDGRPGGQRKRRHEEDLQGLRHHPCFVHGSRHALYLRALPQLRHVRAAQTIS